MGTQSNPQEQTFLSLREEQSIKAHSDKACVRIHGQSHPLVHFRRITYLLVPP